MLCSLLDEDTLYLRNASFSPERSTILREVNNRKQTTSLSEKVNREHVVFHLVEQADVSLL